MRFYLTLLFLSVIVFTPMNIDADNIMVLKLGYSASLSNPWHICAMRFAKDISQKTAGKVKIDLFPNETIGTDLQMAEMVRTGALDMQIAPQGVIANYEPKLSLLELPFLFDSATKAGKLLDGPLGEELVKDLPRKGIRVLAYWENGLRHITNNRYPIQKPYDLIGLKIRVPDNMMTISIFKTLGANPAPLAYNQLYGALENGVFDGQENPITNIHSSRIYEVQKYLTMSYHKYESKPFIINDKLWQSLTPRVQKIIKDAAKKYAIENRKMFYESEIQLLDDLKQKGMIVNYPKLEPFREATKPVYNEWRKILGNELIQKIIKAAQ